MVSEQPIGLSQRQPSTAVADLVEAIWDWDIPDGDAATALTIRVPPSTAPYFVVQYRTLTYCRWQLGAERRRRARRSRRRCVRADGCERRWRAATLRTSSFALSGGPHYGLELGADDYLAKTFGRMGPDILQDAITHDMPDPQRALLAGDIPE